MAGRAGQARLLPHRPLKIDFAAVTAVMSSAYATRFGCAAGAGGAAGGGGGDDPALPAGVGEGSRRHPEEGDPPGGGQPGRRGALSGRVLQPGPLGEERRAEQRRPRGGSSLSSFEQLVEIGQANNRQYDANDRHIINIVDWLWQYAFEQRASDIHIEPGATWAWCASASTGAASGLSDADAGAGGDDQPHQDPRPDGRGGKAPAPGRPHEDPGGQRQGGRAAPRHAAHGLRREAGDAHLRPEVLVRNMVELGFSEQDEARWKS